MRRAGCEVDEEGLFWSQCLLVLDPCDCLVRHVRQEVVARILRQLDRVDAIIDEGCPLVGLAAQKPIELVEALADRPTVEWPRDTRFPSGELVPFAEGPSAVAVEPQHLCERCNVVRDLARVAWKGRTGFDDSTHVRDMMITPALERRAGR